MKKNQVLFVALAVGFLLFWQSYVLRTRQAQSPAASTATPSLSAPDNATPVPAMAPASKDAAAPLTVAPTLAAKTAVVSFASDRVTFNLTDGAIQQWQVKEESDQWIALVPGAFLGRWSPGPFSGVLYEVEREGREEVALLAHRSDGLVIRKTYTFTDNHLNTLTMELTNTSPAPLDASFVLGWGPGLESGDDNAKDNLHSQRAVAFEAPKLWKLKEPAQSGRFQWWGMDSRYFLAVFFASDETPYPLRLQKEGDYVGVSREYKNTLAAGQSARLTFPFYLGPKGYKLLASFDKGLERAVDFGWFREVGQVLLRCLYWGQGLLSNYGWAIVLLTVFVQLLLLPLTISMFKQGQRMKVLQPHIKRLQTLHKGDARRINEEMMALYKRHGVKFMGMGGCLPLFLQMPIFIALYNTIRNAYELRHAPWLGWIKDLSTHDPYYVMPVFYCLTMLLQNKITLTSVDPAQRQMMYIMPFFLLFLFAKLPAGLVLYFCASILVTIAIQFILLKRASMQAVA